MIGLKYRRPRVFAVLASVVLVAGCSGVPEDGRLIADPYEPLNRGVHVFNKGVDQGLIRPAATVYVALTPELIRFLIDNGASHIRLPVDVANRLLQGELMEALATAGRFGVNTVFGAAGLLDPATSVGLPDNPTGFGETLYIWGAPEGAYVELPLLGPSTERDTVGLIVDAALSPSTYVTGTPESQILLGLRGGDILNARVKFGEEIDQFLYESEDSYVVLKTTYVQVRRAELAGDAEDDGNTALPDIFDE